nr:hypothetical protein [Lysinibacillus timonensis]
MANQRKQIILNEILFWKQSKLLPEHYCDFLMTLYSEGNEVAQVENINYKNAIKAKEKRHTNLLTGMIFGISIIFLVLLFTLNQFNTVVIICSFIFALTAFSLGVYFAKKKGLVTPILHIIAALLLLGVSVKFSLTYFEHNQILLFLLLILNCILWFAVGLVTRLMYFIVSGALGVIVLIAYQFFIY